MAQTVDLPSQIHILFANDSHGRVRLAALSIASLMDNDVIAETVDALSKQPVDKWMHQAYSALGGKAGPNVYDPKAHQVEIPKHITDKKIKKAYV